MRLVSLAVVVTTLVLSLPYRSQEIKSRYFPAGTSVTAKVNAILPRKTEEAYQKIPWRLNIMQAREDAQRANKPLFVWVMNGHPLCGT